jgi:UPF0755 protein
MTASYLSTGVWGLVFQEGLLQGMVRRRRTSRKKSGLGCGGMLLGLFLMALICAGGAAWFVFLPAGPAGETFVEIPPGSSSTQIGVQLEKAGVVRSRYGFDLVRAWKHGVLKAGEYRFDHAAPVTEVYARIARGDVFTLPVTIPEGATRFDIAARVEQAGLVKKEDFFAASVPRPLGLAWGPVWGTGIRHATYTPW